MPQVQGTYPSNGALFHVHGEDLSVVYQPIVHSDSLEVFAYEALVRCAVPAFANPEVLFHHATRAGCCGELGRLIRSLAVPLCPGMPLFLNVHPQELEQRWIVRPDDPLCSHDRAVYLEITESVPFEDFDLCWRVLRDVRSRSNARLVIDDLGVGFSNLGRLTQLSPDVVKLDRQLILKITKDSRQQKLVAGVVRLCKDLGQTVVAEGVETVEELDAVRETEAQFVQGYLFGRPAFPPPAIVRAAGLTVAAVGRERVHLVALPTPSDRRRAPRIGGAP